MHCLLAFSDDQHANPELKRNRDLHHAIFLQLTTQFQSTRPCGARPWSKQKHAFFKSFNPRARVGRDMIAQKRFNPYLVSIHAPVWGAT